MPPYSAAAAAAAAPSQAAVPMVSLAHQAYDSLCYDFPVVDTAALAALATSYRTTLCGNGRLPFPITLRFVSGLQYLVELHFQQKRSAAVQNDVDSRSNHLVTLCGCVFLKAPARGITTATRDNGASLNRLLTSFVDFQETEQNILGSSEESCLEAIPESTTENQNLGLSDEQMAAELDDDDTEWEPIETHSIQTEPVGMAANIVTQASPTAEWPEFITKATALGSLAPSEVTSIGAAWNDLQLSEDLINALKVLRQVEKTKSVDVMPLARLYAGVLCDRVSDSASSLTRGQEYGRLVTAMISMADDTELTGMSTNDSKSWQCLTLRVLATLSYKLRGSGNQERALWQTLSSSLLFLQKQLTRLLVGASITVLTEEVEMVFQSLCFWLKHAPGNASVGPSLMQSGLLRNALQVFLKAGTEPQMESLRGFLLLALARSTEVARYLVEVPTFEAAVSDPKFLKEDSLTRPHGLVWPILLRAGCWQKTSVAPQLLAQAEDILVHELDHIAVLADNGGLLTEPVVLARFSQVLQQLETACSASSNRFWQRGSCLDRGLARCYTALCSLSATLRNLEYQNLEGKEKDDDQERKTEKIAEMLSRMLPMLKKVTVVTRGDGSSKAD